MKAATALFPISFFFFFLPLNYVDNHVRPYEYNLSLMQSNYLEMPVNTKLIQLTWDLALPAQGHCL